MNPTLKVVIVAVALIFAGALLAGCGLWSMNGQWDQLAGNNNLVTAEQTISGDFTNIDADVFWLDVELRPSPDGTCHYRSVTYKTMPCTVTVENGTLKIHQPDNRKPHEYIGVFWGDTVLQVYLPENTYESLTFRGETSDLSVAADFRFRDVTVENSTGDVDFRGQVENDLDITCSTGDITLRGVSAEAVCATVSTGDVISKDVTCDTMTVSTSSGHCTLQNVSVAETFSATSTSGKKSLTDVTCGALYLKATTGDTVLANVVVSGDAVITASTGDVEFTGFDAANIRIETSTGEVEGTLLSSKIFYVDTSTGDVDVPRTNEGGACDITTSTGNIEIDIRK